MQLRTQYEKKGLRTSMGALESQYVVNAPQNYQGVIGEVSSTYVNGPTSVYMNTKPAVNVQDQFNGAKKEVTFNYLGQNAGHFVPPPPERFLMSSGHTLNQSGNPQTQSQYIRHVQPGPGAQIVYPADFARQIQNGQMVQQIQPLYQSVHKTFIPHHIYNEIPIQTSETKRYYESQNQQGEEVEEQSNGGEVDVDEQMLKQYQKIYALHIEQKTKNQQLSRQLEQYENRLNQKQNYIRTLINNAGNKEANQNKQKQKEWRVNVKLLASIILKKQKSLLSDTVTRKKTSCLNKLRTLFGDEQNIMKTSMLRMTEEITIRKVK